MGSTLGASESSRSFIPDSFPVGALTLDPDGSVMAINDLAAEVLGLDRGAAVGIRLSDVVDTPSGEALVAHLNEASQADGLCRCTIEVRGDEGRTRHVLLQTTRSPDEERGHAFQVILSDVTEYVERAQLADSARLSAERVARSKIDFLARLSHEIRSALASMIGFADVLLDEMSDANREIVVIIMQSGRHLLDTLNAVMDLSQFELQTGNVKLEEVDVVVRARERTAVFRSMIDRNGPAIEFRTESESAVAELNETLLDRILHNLIDNAIKYTKKGKVEVGVEEREDEVLIYVADTGMGIDEQFMPRLFSPFERAKRGVEVSAEGVGLGLTITKYLVELMGGRISACSTKGEGSTFTVRFPSPVRGRTTEEA